MKIKAIIEIPAWSMYKYEVNKVSGRLVLDRVLNRLIPHNYGYFPYTLFDDGDPLDVFIVSLHPIPSLTEVEVEVYGIFRCKDGGIQDDKILAYLPGEYRSGEGLDSYNSSIREYLENYKPGFLVESYGTAEEAKEVYNKSVVTYVDSLNVARVDFLNS